MENYMICEVTKEYILSVAGINFDIKARIKKNITPGDDLFFIWEISHHFKPEKAAPEVYIPSSTQGLTFEDCELSLFKYLNKFTAFGIQPNTRY
jgi:hypothetical protein